SSPAPPAARSSPLSARPAPPPAEPSTSLLAEVEAAWPRILARLREARQPKTAAFLIEGRPVSVQADGVLVVEFPPERRFHRDSLERGKHRTYVEKAIVDVLGRPLQVRTRVRDEGADAGPDSRDGGPVSGEGPGTASPAGPEGSRG